MIKNVSDFIDPISIAQPTGTDIEYDTRFIDIQSLVEGKPEQQYGDIIIEAQEPDWSTIEKLCCQILSESKDLRVFCFYIQALTASYGIIGFKRGCEIIYNNINNYWEDLYPKLIDEDGNFDTFYRLGSIELLLAENGITQQLNESKIKVTPDKKIYFNIKSITSVLTNNEDNSYPGGREKLIEDLKVAYENQQEEILALKSALDFLKHIEENFKENIKDFSLDFSIIKRPLEIIDKFLTTSKRIVENTTNTSSIDNNTISTNKDFVASPISIYNLDDIKILDRNDVKVVLEKLNIYFRSKEPSHPAPLFIDRLQKLMDMSFYEILKNISPSSLNDLDIIIGKDYTNEESNEE